MSRSIWESLSGWPVVGAVVAALISVGGTLTSVGEFRVTKWLVTAVAALMIAKGSAWLIGSPLGYTGRIGAVALLWAVTGSLWAGIWVWVTERGGAQAAAAQTAAPVPVQPPKNRQTEPGSKDEKLQVLLTHAAGGGEIGFMARTPECWYWLIGNLTVVNQGPSDDTVAFELRVPVGTGVVHHLQPLTDVPLQVRIQPGTVLFGVVDIRTRKSLTGALLFRLDRLNIPRVDVKDPELSVRPEFDQPDVVSAKLVVKSLLSGRERDFHAVSLAEGMR